MRRFVFACLIAACAAMAPTLASAGDQEIAQFIVERLSQERDQGRLKGFDLDLHVENGTVWFKGTVSNDAQKNLVISTAQAGQNLGVVQIVDEISVLPAQVDVHAAPPVVQAADSADSARRRELNNQLPPVDVQSPRLDRQVQVADASSYLRNASQPGAADVQTVQHNQVVSTRAQQPVGTGRRTPLASAPAQSVSYQQPMYQQPMMGQGGPMPAYLPAAQSQPAAHYDQPNMPGYAWPSYASHPNYSAVTYPTTYSPTAWPYIGPFYPYPQVPLGWRKVTLEWDDGWWYLDFDDR